MYGVPEALPFWDVGLYFIMEAGVADGAATDPSAEAGFGGGGIHVSEDAERGGVSWSIVTCEACVGCWTFCGCGKMMCLSTIPVNDCFLLFGAIVCLDFIVWGVAFFLVFRGRSTGKSFPFASPLRSIGVGDPARELSAVCG